MPDASVSSTTSGPEGALISRGHPEPSLHGPGSSCTGWHTSALSEGTSRVKAAVAVCAESSPRLGTPYG